MACSSCSSGGGLPKGCKNNGSCGTDGCNSYPVFDWLANMRLPQDQKPFDIVEVRFKNGRKEFFRNSNELSLSLGDALVVDTQPGHDIGSLSMSGELVRLQLRKRNALKVEEFPTVVRKATQTDLDLWKEVRGKEEETMIKAREMAEKLNLEMKISDVEFQGDGQRATFYYTAEKRVDFRQLIREYASSFKVRVEMRHIGSRQEASRLGGIGSCGRELCCSTWLHDFRTVSTSAARYQQLALNPQKLAGQCGKLKCCLNYELDTYLEALDGFPDTNKKLQTEKGVAVFMKMDIFNGHLWYAYKEDSSSWHKMEAEDVKTILHKNKQGQKVASLEEFVLEDVVVEDNSELVSIEHGALDRFDDRSRNKKRRKKKRPTQAKGDAAAKSSANVKTEAKPKRKPANKAKGPSPEGKEERKGNHPRNKNRRNQKGPKPSNPQGQASSNSSTDSAEKPKNPRSRRNGRNRR